MTDPFFIAGPAILNVSGGRTSGYLLWRVLQAHGGVLPPDVHAVFDNTGKEREETLRFLYEMGERWGVLIHWIEYRNDDRGYEVVGYNSASRNGEPFAALIAKKGYVPNRGAPYCSIELKARTTRDWVYGELGWKPQWKSVLGIRHDEQRRVMGAIGRNASGKDPWRNLLPLDTAKIVNRNVMTFWGAQDFDLGLLGYQGNCSRCWKKSLTKLRRIVRDEQEGATPADPWWSQQEMATASTFHPHLSHAEIEQQTRNEPMMDLPHPEDDEGDDEECGFTCFISDADQIEIGEVA